jgi:hypothetical protein
MADDTLIKPAGIPTQDGYVPVREGYQPTGRGHQPTNQSGNCAPTDLKIPSFQTGIQTPVSPGASGAPAKGEGQS